MEKNNYSTIGILTFWRSYIECVKYFKITKNKKINLIPIFSLLSLGKINEDGPKVTGAS